MTIAPNSRSQGTHHSGENRNAQDKKQDDLHCSPMTLLSVTSKQHMRLKSCQVNLLLFRNVPFKYASIQYTYIFKCFIHTRQTKRSVLSTLALSDSVSPNPDIKSCTTTVREQIDKGRALSKYNYLCCLCLRREHVPVHFKKVSFPLYNHYITDNNAMLPCAITNSSVDL